MRKKKIKKLKLKQATGYVFMHHLAEVYQKINILVDRVNKLEEEKARG